MKSLFTKSLLLSVILAPFFITPVLADDEESGTLFKNILQRGGVLPDKRNDIRYQERPPLVLPPSVTRAEIALPSPSQSASKQSAAWPKDPEIEARQRKAERDKKPRTVASSQGRLLTPDELKANGAAINSGQKIDVDNNPTSFVPLGKLFSNKKDEENRLEFKGEKERTTLLKPPPGYMTPAASQPYGPVGRTDYAIPKNLEYDPKKAQ